MIVSALDVTSVGLSASEYGAGGAVMAAFMSYLYWVERRHRSERKVADQQRAQQQTELLDAHRKERCEWRDDMGKCVEGVRDDAQETRAVIRELTDAIRGTNKL